MVTTNPTRDNITVTHLSTDRGFAQALTEYAMHASPERIAQMMEKAYGDHGPDSLKRWHEQQSARQDLAQWARDRRGWVFYRRVHGKPSPAEARRLEFEQSTRDRAHRGGQR